ncbi:MAG TPA: NUDIX hydrolase [Candidatus Thermoplasmatota archaeon]|nr:NUDIX hydrolase [Candidatus Thermoplasmatota archaeon]
MPRARHPSRIPVGPDGRMRHALTADAVLVERGRVLLVRRGNPPFRGRLALPGGFVAGDESAEDAVLRELAEETGLEGRVLGLVGLYSAPGRDPRGPTATAVYLVERAGGRLQAGDDAASATFVPVPLARRTALAFDHSAVLRDALLFRAALLRALLGAPSRTRRAPRRP